MSKIITEATLDKITEDTGKALSKQDKVKICLPMVPGEQEQEAVCVNGVWTVLKRGAEVCVPQAVFEVLRNAEMV